MRPAANRQQDAEKVSLRVILSPEGICIPERCACGRSGFRFLGGQPDFELESVSICYLSLLAFYSKPPLKSSAPLLTTVLEWRQEFLVDARDDDIVRIHHLR